MSPDEDTGEFAATQETMTGETEEFDAPAAPAVAVDPGTGQLPAGWSFADE